MSKLAVPILVVALGLLLGACQSTTGNTAGAELRNQAPSAENGWAGTHRYDRGR